VAGAYLTAPQLAEAALAALQGAVLDEAGGAAAQLLTSDLLGLPAVAARV
jgi:hypothetical protein